VSYTKLSSLPMGYGNRPYLAWYGDMTLGDHLWHFARLGPARVVVEFHEPITIADFRSRKELTQHCYDRVSSGVANALHGKSG